MLVYPSLKHYDIITQLSPTSIDFYNMLKKLSMWEYTKKDNK